MSDGTQEALHAEAPGSEEVPEVRAQVTRLPYAGVQGGMYAITIMLTVAMVVLLWMVHSTTKSMGENLKATQERIEILETEIKPAAKRAPPFLDEGMPVLRQGLPLIKDARPFLRNTSAQLEVTVGTIERMETMLALLTDPALPTLRRLEDVDVGGFIRNADGTLARLDTVIGDPRLMSTLGNLDTLLGDAIAMDVFGGLTKAFAVTPQLSRGIATFRRFARRSLPIQMRLESSLAESLELQRELLVVIKRIDRRLGGRATAPPPVPVPAP